MASTVAGVSASAARLAPTAAAPPKKALSFSVRMLIDQRPRMSWRVASTGPATPSNIAKSLSESIEDAQEICAGDPVSGECIAAWDEVEELSAAASHARAKSKTTDPLEEYCKDNPETDECRTYDD